MNHFKAISQLKNNELHRFGSSVIPLIAIERLLSDINTNDPMMKAIEHIKSSDQTIEESNKPISFLAAGTIVTKLNALHTRVIDKKQRKLLKKSESYRAVVEPLKKKALNMSPSLENRIICFESSGQESLIKADSELE